jgi:replicative DNA helicase
VSAEHEVFTALARELLRRAMAEEDVAQIREWALQTLVQMGGGQVGSGVLEWMDSFSFFESLLDRRAAELALPEAQRKRLDWPWPSWNRLLDPLGAGMLGAIAGGDGMGKTVYGEMIAEHWAKKGNRVVFVHFELNHETMMDRRYARHTNLTARQLKEELSETQRAAVRMASDSLAVWGGNIRYQHAPGWTMQRVVAQLGDMYQAVGFDAVVVDYLEKATASRRQVQLFGNNLYQREADNVELLKDFAEMRAVPIVMLSQLNKQGKNASFADLGRTDMRGAGEKSERANMVVLLHRERVGNGLYSPMVSVRVEKQTMGVMGVMEQVLKGEYFRVEDVCLDEEA